MDTHLIAKKVKQAFPEFKDNIIATTETISIGCTNHDIFLSALMVDPNSFTTYVKWDGDASKETPLGPLDWTNEQTLADSLIEKISEHYDDIKKSIEKAEILLDESNWITLEELGFKKTYTFYEMVLGEYGAIVTIVQPFLTKFRWDMHVEFKEFGTKDYWFHGNNVEEILRKMIVNA